MIETSEDLTSTTGRTVAFASFWIAWWLLFELNDAQSKLLCLSLLHLFWLLGLLLLCLLFNLDKDLLRLCSFLGSNEGITPGYRLFSQ